MAGKIIGVLALQGAFIKHIEMLQQMGISAIQVRHAHDLERCDGLILPGGESTTMHRQIQFAKLKEALQEFTQTHVTFGTCAGLILLSQWGALNIEVKRNGYGPQIESCQRDLSIKIPGKKKRSFPGIFIRAPKILSIGEGVNVLSEIDGEPVLIQQENILAATFHPELTSDTFVHEFFLKIFRKITSEHQ